MKGCGLRGVGLSVKCLGFKGFEYLSLKIGLTRPNPKLKIIII